MTLAARLFLLIALALLPPLAIQAWTGLEQWHRRETELRAQAVAYSRALQADMARLAVGVHQLLVALAEVPAVRDGDARACTAYLQAVAGQFPAYALLAVNGTNGSILCNSAGAVPGEYSNAARAYHRRAMASGGFVAGDLVTGVATGRRSLHFALPFRRPDGMVGGIVLASVDQARLAELLSTAPLPPGAEAVLIDPSGIIAAGAQDGRPVTGGWVGRSAPAALFEALRAPESRAIETFGPDGTPRLFGVVLPDPALGGILVAAGLDRERALADLRRAYASGLIALALGGALALGAGALGARRFVLAPLARLTAAADRVGGGELGARADLGRRSGAMREVGAAFDRMATALAAREVERDRAAEALREAEDDLRHTVELNPQIAWTANPDGEILGFSPRWLEATGLTHDAALGDGWRKVPHPDDLPAMGAAWTRSVMTGKPYDVEVRLRMADCSYRWWRVRAFPRRDASGRIVRWYGTTEDVHERMTAVTALAESERWNREALERLGESLYALDAGYRIVFASRRALNIWGKSNIEAIGHRLDQIVPQVTGGMLWQMTQRGVQRKEEVHLCCLSPLSGRWMEGDVYPTDSGGVIIALRDVDDRRRAEIERVKAVGKLAEDERYYRALAEVGATSHWRADLTGAVVSSRGGWEALTGQPSVETRGDGWMRMVHPEDLPKIAKTWRAVIAARETGSAEFRVRTRQEAWCWVRARAVPVRDDGGEMLGWSGIVEDVDARRRAEDALRESEARFARAVEAARVGAWEWDPTTDTMSHSAGHETMLGRPLGSLPNFPEVLKAVHPKDRRIVVEAAQRNLMRETDRYEAQFRTVWLDGTLRWLRAVGRAEVGPDGTVRRLSGVCMDVTEQVEDQRRRDLLAREVDHRAKNALAVVQSVLRLTPANDAKAFAAAVEGRVAALARVHSLLAEKGWFGADLRMVVERELAPYAEHFDRKASIALEGAQVTLAATAVQPFGMVLHELATNAAKYGALSTREGRVDVTWRAGQRFGEDGMLRLCWAERGGPILTSIPARRGFGSRLIESTVRGQLGGSLEQCWAPNGLICTIAVPLARVAADRSVNS